MPGPLGRTEEPAAAAGAASTSRQRRQFSPARRLELVESYLSGSQTQAQFCAANDLSLGSLVAWLSRYERSGASGLANRPRGRAVAKRRERQREVQRHSAEEKRAIVEAYAATELTQAAFAKTFGICVKTLNLWLAAYRKDGPRGLEPKAPGRKPGAGSSSPLSGARIPSSVQDEIVAVKRRFPDFGLRKIRDFLLRFRGMAVSPGGIGATLDRAGVDRAERVVKRRRKPDQVRRFERARPMELWQTDITSFYLGRESRRVYLVAFVDDRSRYVVSFALAHQQRGDLVIEALRDGISRFGKPKEVLSDQGRQYYAWRGKSEFQKLLHREGIQHVVARAHHPETVGKCERLWATIQKEFWSKTLPQSIDEARLRLSHYIAHYNHFRPHQGIGGLVPADRFFEAEEAARQTIEAAIAKQPLTRALEAKVRRPVFLFGQIGDRQVSLHGEHGRVVIQTDDGKREEIELEAAPTENQNDGRDDDFGDDGGDQGDGLDGGEDDGDDADGDPTPRSTVEEAAALQDTGSAGAERAGDLGKGESGRATGGASLGRGDSRDLGGSDDAQGGG